MAHDVHWYSPAPIWSKRMEDGTRERLTRPDLLKFEQDEFMERLQETLKGPSSQFGDRRAGGKGAEGESEAITLYHPANQRYYLVTASLVCRKRGLPDRAVDTANDERVSFVFRRLIGGQEYGWFGEKHGWYPVDARRSNGEEVEDNNGIPEKIEEERIPMFPQDYQPNTPQERMKGKRRLWAGLIPVARRDTYETASVQRKEQPEKPEVPEDDPLSDSRKTIFQTRVIVAFKELRDHLRTSDSLIAEDVRDPLVFAWFDLWQFLDTHLSDVAEEIKRGNEELAEAADFDRKGVHKVALLDVLRGAPVSYVDLESGDKAIDLLRTIAKYADDIEKGELDKVMGATSISTDQLTRDLERLLWNRASDDIDTDSKTELRRKVYAALPKGGKQRRSDDPQPPSTEPIDGGLYAVRCIYERPDCPPSKKAIVSERTRSFRLASFFDAEAPVRDINITLPGATVQDFRDSSQSVTMRFTKELRNQVQRFKDIKLKDLQNGETGSSPAAGVGMICSLSIPIITICALVLLLIMVSLLNIIFWWLPFFKICFPLPKSLSGGE